MFKGNHITTSFVTIEPWQGYKVPFVLLDITRRHEMYLDIYEGYPVFFERQSVEVESDDGLGLLKHLIFNNPQGGLCDGGGKQINLNAVKLRD